MHLHHPPYIYIYIMHLHHPPVTQIVRVNVFILNPIQIGRGDS